MTFNKHYELEGRHARLSASKHHWINYDEDKLERMLMADEARRKGDRLHRLAHDLIREGVKLPKSNKTLNSYVNDAIGYRMTPEQPLYYSDNAFGTADAISFRRNLLRIHDLKTGALEASVQQLEVYAALFCHEYKFKPHEIDIEMRIYQNDEIKVWEADPSEIIRIMEQIRILDKRITEFRLEAMS